MRIVCPSCSKTQEVIPDDLIGRCAVCTECHSIFLWRNTAVSREARETPKSKDKSDGGGTFRIPS
jgi:hypothetical protein